MRKVDVRSLRFDGDIAFIPLSRGLEAMIDAADAHLVDRQNWHAVDYGNSFYAASNIVKQDGKRGCVLLHRLILNAPPSMEVDHIWGNGLDNRRSQIRLATRFQNRRNRGLDHNNTSGFKGVSWSKLHNKWRADISFDGKYKHLGLFQTPEAAHSAYSIAAQKYHGEFARLA